MVTARRPLAGEIRRWAACVLSHVGAWARCAPPASSSAGGSRASCSDGVGSAERSSSSSVSTPSGW